MVAKQTYLKSLKAYSDIEVELNRLYTKKAALQHKLKTLEKTERKARVRTLIQLGGLLKISPFFTLCEIELGDDLQINHQDKADILLGMLNSVSDSLPKNLTESDFEHFKNIGTYLRLSHKMNKKTITQTQKPDDEGE